MAQLTEVLFGRSPVRFPIVPLESFIDLKPCGRTMALGVDSTSNINDYQGYFPGVKAAGVYG